MGSCRLRIIDKALDAHSTAAEALSGLFVCACVCMCANGVSLYDVATEDAQLNVRTVDSVRS